MAKISSTDQKTIFQINLKHMLNDNKENHHGFYKYIAY